MFAWRSTAASSSSCPTQHLRNCPRSVSAGDGYNADADTQGRGRHVRQLHLPALQHGLGAVDDQQARRSTGRRAEDVRQPPAEQRLELNRRRRQVAQAHGRDGGSRRFHLLGGP